MTHIKKLSIVFITNNWHPFNAGVVSSIVAYRKELEHQGHCVTLITLDFPGSDSLGEPGVQRVYCPIKLTYRSIPVAIPFNATHQIRNIVTDLKPDIIHCHHPFLLGMAGLKVAREKNIPCVFTYHSLYEKYTHYAPLCRKLVTRFVRARVRSFCKHMSGIITPGRETVRLLERDGVTVPHILLPSPLQEVYLERSCVLQNMPHDTQRKPFRLMTCSRFVQEKNIPFLLDMFAQLDQTQFTFTLAGFGSELEALQKYAYETLKLSPDVVRFAVKVENEALRSLYEHADVFVFSSLADTQGLVLAEAMASGLPVIALNGPGQEDIVENGANGYLIESPHEMRVAVELIARDPALYAQLRKKAFVTAQKYNPTTLTHTLVSFYMSLIRS